MDEFTYESLLEELNSIKMEQYESDKKLAVSKLVPSIFVTEGDRIDTFALEANGKWSKDKYPRELLPVIMEYKKSLLKELREAEYYIKYLQSEGLYPIGRIKIKIEYEEKDDNSV